MSARDEVLARIRSAIGSRPRSRLDGYERLPREYEREGTLDAGARLALFANRIEHYNGGVDRCAPRQIADAVARALRARAKRRILVPRGVPAEWLSADFDWIVDEGLGSAALDACDGVLTGCSAAIAATGTIVLRHDAIEGRRAITLVPDYHVCVVRADQVVETVPEAFARLAASRPTLVTTISGPSATSDIEMTRIKGVHGPRTLDVIIVDARSRD